jgi:hypothetical protein
MISEIQRYTEQLFEDLNLPDGLHADENKVYTLNLGEGLIIQYADLNPGLELMSYLGGLVEENKETFLMALMRVNLFGKGTGGGILGYDPRNRNISYSLAFPHSLTYKEFRHAIEDFINYVELWTGEFMKSRRGEKSLLDF